MIIDHTQEVKELKENNEQLSNTKIANLFYMAIK